MRKESTFHVKVRESSISTFKMKRMFVIYCSSTYIYLILDTELVYTYRDNCGLVL